MTPDGAPLALDGPQSAQARVGAAAAALVAARLSGGQFDPFPPGAAPIDADEAYRVQRAAHSLLCASGFGARVGWKIGCTAAVMQAYLGIDSPSAGGMFLANLWRATHHFTIAAPRRLGVECELAVRIGRDLPGVPGGYDLAAVGSAVAASMAAIEVVEDRYVDYASLDTPTLLADDFFHRAAVLGAENEGFDPRELRDVTASMSLNGAPVGEGRGADILGEPLDVLAWLADRAAGWGTPLRAGDVVLLGSLVQTHWVKPGDVVAVANDRLGPVGATFAPV